ncbi:MAG TPA: NAD(P)/FAD-dependent oxidoreductase [Candidatus Eisenbergiella merdavium]|uniref:NAD(P)/FAD-dependent oxidoreductase n=2 Tax=Eisenbergiella TaxID=1432051 RepID=A0A9D2MSJ4_9FIRM|nr:NAD(P)/FAD-dependent oxidoreductase [Candidatus Eisenbergiella merdigallinarum]HJC22248.1 NAD(P)/FAD-dependent oxidoreductase [Candidatus Eisenbergiella merdavium]
MRKALIIGGGPAGLTAAYELLKASETAASAERFEVIVFEESGQLGGISKTVEHNGNRMDMGGHRFFSKDPKVNEWWNHMLPPQGAPAYDDIVLKRTPPLAAGGPDPEKTDRVMLTRNRVSRIYFDRKFFDYPITLKWETFKNMGLATTIQAGFSYIASVLHKRKENSLEDFYINRFGKKLYSMFFEKYTENLWGRSPAEIDPNWGAQRVKGLSIMAIISDIFRKLLPGKKTGHVETSLIEEFSYPKLGPGQLWDVTGAEIEKMGGRILRGCRVVRFSRDENGRILSLTYEKDGKEYQEEGDIFISSMPIKDLVGGMNDVPAREAAIAAGLPYRDYMTLGVLVPKLNLVNKTKIKTIGNIVPDDWIYVHDRTVQMGRFQIYNNWSPYMVKDLENTVWVGLEYFCDEGDSLWRMSEEEFSVFAVSEMVKMGLIDSPDMVLDTHMEKVKKAYPAYFDTYKDMDVLRDWLNTIDNLYCVGRNGQHRYNNIDHSMVTSFETVKNILSGVRSRDNIWNVNTEKEYLEGNGKG